MTKDSLGDRMKNLYENTFRFFLPGRMPVIIRVDGKAFHSYTKNMKRPFDDNLTSALNEVAIHLCKIIQGTQIAYLQSDEINLLVHNYKTIKTQSWFHNNLCKMISISAGEASSKLTEISIVHFGKNQPAVFDSRAFVIPESDVTNYFLWRQQDATRNSIQMLARSLFSHKQCLNKNCKQLQEMCFQAGHNWNNLPSYYKRGRCIVKKSYIPEDFSCRKQWIIDNNIPTFSDNRNYIEDLLSEDNLDAKPKTNKKILAPMGLDGYIRD